MYIYIYVYIYTNSHPRGRSGVSPRPLRTCRRTRQRPTAPPPRYIHTAPHPQSIVKRMRLQLGKVPYCTSYATFPLSA